MEAITPHAGRLIFARQREARRDDRHGVMEGRVETGNLEKVRPRGGDSTHRRDIMRLVQRRERRQPIERREQFGRHSFGPAMVGAAMHHAMTDGDKMIGAEMSLGPTNHRFEQRLEVLAGVRPASFGEHCAFRTAREKMRR